MISNSELLVYPAKDLERKELKRLLSSLLSEHESAGILAMAIGWQPAKVQRVLRRETVPDLPGEPLFSLTFDDVCGQTPSAAKQRIRQALVVAVLYLRYKRLIGRYLGLSAREVGRVLAALGLALDDDDDLASDDTDPQDDE